jgi:5'-3' exoribonuclease 2
VLTSHFTSSDGVAPRAKMNQQRARRFRSAQEAREADEKKEEFRKLQGRQNGNKDDQDIKEHVIQKTWDSNVITPGTPFMDILAASLRYWVAYKLNSDPAWEEVDSKITFVLSVLILLS